MKITTWQEEEHQKDKHWEVREESLDPVSSLILFTCTHHRPYLPVLSTATPGNQHQSSSLPLCHLVPIKWRTDEWNVWSQNVTVASYLITGFLQKLEWKKALFLLRMCFLETWPKTSCKLFHNTTVQHTPQHNSVTHSVYLWLLWQQPTKPHEAGQHRKVQLHIVKHSIA